MAKIYGQLERAQLENLASDPSAGTRGRVFWNNTLGRARVDNGSTIEDLGSGSSSASGINYIDNPNAETNTNGWATYADAAAAIPVDGTGGSPSSTFTRTTSSPLRSTASFLLSKSAANRQGEGASYDFAIDAADKQRSLRISFDFEASANFVAGDASDVRVFIYDVDNAAIIYPYETKILTADGKFQVLFDASTATNYRLILHIATTSALAWTFKLDNVQVGPQDLVQSAPMSDWASFTQTGTWVTNTTYSAFYRRVGDMLEVQGVIDTSGAPDSASLLLDLPPGLQIDTSKGSFVSDESVIGQVIFDDSGTRYMGAMRYFSATQVKPSYLQDSGSLEQVVTASETAPFTFGAGDSVYFKYSVPVAGWSSNVVLSNATTFRMSNILANGTNVTTVPAVLGEYRTLIKDISALTGTDSAPSDAPSVANAMHLYGNVAYGSAGTAGQIGKWVIFVGKNKLVSLEFYAATGKAGQANADFSQKSATVASGVSWSYNPITGNVVVDAFNQESGTTTRYAASTLTEDGTALSNDADIYFDIIVSEKIIAVTIEKDDDHSYFHVTFPNGHGSTNNKIRRFTNTLDSFGDAISYSGDSPTLGSSFTILKPGFYIMEYSDGRSTTTNRGFGISLNSAQLTTSVEGITNVDRLGYAVADGSGANAVANLVVGKYLSIGDVIRPHTQGGMDNNQSSAYFRISRAGD